MAILAITIYVLSLVFVFYLHIRSEKFLKKEILIWRTEAKRFEGFVIQLRRENAFLKSEVKRLDIWQDAHKGNVSYMSRFRMKANSYGHEAYLINDTIKYFIQDGVVFEHKGFIQFSNLEVAGK